MLLSFSVENFRSFHAEQTINLLASKRLGDPIPPYCSEVPGTGEHVLRVTSLYGANGAGKSNIVRALATLERLVLHGTPRDGQMPYQPFRLDDGSTTKPTVFDLRFVAEGEVYRYGICYDADRVHEEWLDVYEGKKERSLFTRSNDENGNVVINFGPSFKDTSIPPKIRALADSGIRFNQLFLAEIVDRDEGTQGPQFRCAINWFRRTLGIITPDARFESLAETIATDEKFAEFATKFLREASTGIANIRGEVKTMLRKKLPPLPKELEDAVDANGTVTTWGPEGQEIVLDASKKDVVRFYRILASHDTAQGKPIEFPLHEESDGSQRLLHLLPALHQIGAGGGVFVVDELERSMHPILARKFIEFFLKVADVAKSQLIFTTHESTLLDLDIMRRDGIWFAEKDQAGASHLYSLADFGVRKDLDIEKGYFSGRFGAVPFLGGIDRLIEQQAESVEKEA